MTFLLDIVISKVGKCEQNVKLVEMFSGRINGLLSKQNMFQKRFHGDLIRAYAVQYFVNSWMMD